MSGLSRPVGRNQAESGVAVEKVLTMQRRPEHGASPESLAVWMR
ncbi:hypothetical protein [uncultured Duncaniella sp.]|nr:hypothetical protein [uncultured Duncaniella sp.]